MKKIYMQPQIAIVVMEQNLLMAESIVRGNDEEFLEEDEILTKDQGDWNIWE